jgi:hypothetical protein
VSTIEGGVIPGTGWDLYLRHLSAVEHAARDIPFPNAQTLLLKQLAYQRDATSRDADLIDTYAEQGLDVTKAVRAKMNPTFRTMFQIAEQGREALDWLTTRGWLVPMQFGKTTKSSVTLYAIAIGET